MKICSRCNKEKDEKEFAKNYKMKDGHLNICKLCNNNVSKIQYKTNPIYREKRKAATYKWVINNRDKKKITDKNNHLKNTYGMSLDEYNNLLNSQNNVCAICKQPETKTLKGKIIALAVDHNHTNNKNRGLLCYNCNNIAGLVDNKLDIILLTIRYIKSFT